MRWKDIIEGEQWTALEFEHTSRARPGLRLEAATSTRLALIAGRAPVLFARIDDWWDDWAWLLADPWPGPLLDPIRADDLRGAPARGTEPWWKFWSRHFAGASSNAKAGPLYRGHWRIGRPLPAGTRAAWHSPRPPAPSGWRNVTRELGLHSDENLPHPEIIALRRPSPDDEDRVKVWRKSARAGALPPVLLWWLPGSINVLLVLDGHDRLLAAQLEKKEPDFLALWHTQSVPMPHDPKARDAMMEGLSRGAPRRSSEALNSALIDAWRPDHQRASLRAWKYAGGWRGWDRDVRALARRLGLVPETTGLVSRGG